MQNRDWAERPTLADSALPIRRHGSEVWRHALQPSLGRAPRPHHFVTRTVKTDTEKHPIGDCVRDRDFLH